MTFPEKKNKFRNIVFKLITAFQIRYKHRAEQIIIIAFYFIFPVYHINVSVNGNVLVAVLKIFKNKNYNCLTIDGLRVNNDTSWALVRASNTGPNITLRFEATTEEELDNLKDEFTKLVEEYKKDLSAN